MAGGIVATPKSSPAKQTVEAKTTVGLSQITNFLTKKGLTKAQASGIAGVLYAESGGNTAALDPKEGAFGLAQWTQGRKAGLESYAKSVGKPVTDASVQLEYLWAELQSSESGTLSKVKATKSTDEAIKVWIAGFERPALENYGAIESRAKGALKEEAGGESLLEEVGGAIGEGANAVANAATAPLKGLEAIGSLANDVAEWIEEPLKPLKVVTGVILLYLGLRTLTRTGGASSASDETGRTIRHVAELAAVGDAAQAGAKAAKAGGHKVRVKLKPKGS